MGKPKYVLEEIPLEESRTDEPRKLALLFGLEEGLLALGVFPGEMRRAKRRRGNYRYVEVDWLVG